MEENWRKTDNSQMLLTSSFSEVSPILKSIYGLLESQPCFSPWSRHYWRRMTERHSDEAYPHRKRRSIYNQTV
ncbi:MAG: hypothetical protein QXZ17_15430 [Nitrososphaerota archaeon]